MRKYSDEITDLLKKYRKEGYSISQLMERFTLPKTTIWHHIHGIKVLEKYIKKIRERQGGSKIRKQRDLKRAEQEAQEIFLSDRKYYCVILAMLYWAEGNKKGFDFTNTNSDMIRTYISILKNDFNIPLSRMSIVIRYFTDMNKEICFRHWQKVTGIPKENISMYYNDGGKRGRSPFGICRLRVKKGGYLSKVVQSLIKTVIDEAINRAPVAQRIRANSS